MPSWAIVVSFRARCSQTEVEKFCPQSASIMPSDIPQLCLPTHYNPSTGHTRALFKRTEVWASLVVQWWRVLRTVQEGPTCCAAAKPVRCNYWACALEPRSRSCWSPGVLEPVLSNKRSHRNERSQHCNQRVAPTLRNYWKAHMQQQRPRTAQNKWINKNYLKTITEILQKLSSPASIPLPSRNFSLSMSELSFIFWTPKTELPAWKL